MGRSLLSSEYTNYNVNMLDPSRRTDPGGDGLVAPPRLDLSLSQENRRRAAKTPAMSADRGRGHKSKVWIPRHDGLIMIVTASLWMMQEEK